MMNQKITSPEQEKSLDDIKKLLQNEITLVDEEKRQFPELGDKTEKIIRTIKRDIDQFDSAVSIVIVVGMLKSGKSTLINLFARNTNASPVGFGVDTTLRPALIKMENPGSTSQGGIDIYFPTETESSLEPGTTEVTAEQTNGEPGKGYNQMLQRLIDELRGIKTEERMPYIKNSHDLNQENLQKILCEKEGTNNLISSEPLLVVIRLPYKEGAELLKQGNYLLDMPGLDSGNAAISYFSDGNSDGKYKKLVDECDMVLCLQSSVAPLNKAAQDCFKAILKTRSSVTAWVLQNNMAHKPWLTKEEIEREEKAQRERAVDVIRKISMSDVKGVNLGEAFAVLLQNEEDLRLGEEMPDKTKIEKDPKSDFYKKSHFGELEKDMIQLIREKGNPARFRHCKDALEEHVKSAHRELVGYKGECEAEKKDLESKRETYEGIQQSVKNEINSSRMYQEGVTCDTSRLEKELRGLSLIDIQKEALDGAPKAKGSDIDKALDEYSRSCLKKTGTFLETIKVCNVVVKKGDKQESKLHEELGEMVGRVLGRLEHRVHDDKGLSDEEKKDLKYALKPSAIDGETWVPVRTSRDVAYVNRQDWFEKYEKRGISTFFREKRYLVTDKSINSDKEEILKRYLIDVKKIFDECKNVWLNEVLKKCVEDKLQEVNDVLAKKVEAAEKVIEEKKELMKKVEQKLEALKGIETIIREKLK